MVKELLEHLPVPLTPSQQAIDGELREGDVPRFQDWLKRKVDASGKPQRALSREIGISHENLQRLLYRQGEAGTDTLRRITAYFGAPDTYRRSWEQQARQKRKRTGIPARRRLTVIGKAISARAKERVLFFREVATELGVGRHAVQDVMYAPGVFPEPPLRKALATFLGWSETAVIQATGRAARIDRCTGRGRFKGLGCGKEAFVPPSYPRRRTGLCRSCYKAAHKGQTDCAHCGATLWRAKGTLKRWDHHFCDRAHYAAWRTGRHLPQRIQAASQPPVRRASTAPVNQRGRNTKRGRARARFRRLRELPSYGKIAAEAGVSIASLRRARRPGARLRLLTRYHLERAGYLPSTDRPPLAVTILDYCVTAGISTTQCAARAGLPYQIIANTIRRGSASPATRAKLAPVLARTPDELEALCIRSPNDAAKAYAAGLLSRTLKAGRTPDIEHLTTNVCKRFPGADEDEIHCYLNKRLSKHRGRGRPRTFTNEQALEVKRLRDEEGWTWAAIGSAMQWAVKRHANGTPRACPMAKRAYQYATQHPTPRTRQTA